MTNKEIEELLTRGFIVFLLLVGVIVIAGFFSTLNP